MRIGRKQTVMILGGAGIAATAAYGFAPLMDISISDVWALPLMLGTIGAQSDPSSSSDPNSDNEGVPLDLITFAPRSRHVELASIGHEYKNIFQVILGHVFLALDRLDLSDPRRSHLEQIQCSAQQGARLADRIHHLSKEVMPNSRPAANGDPGS